MGEVKALSYGYTAAMEAAWYVDCLESNGDSAETGFDLRGVLIGPGTGQNLIAVFTFPEGGWGGILYKQIPGRGRTPSFLKKFWEGIVALAGAIKIQVEMANGNMDAGAAGIVNATPEELVELGILTEIEEDALIGS